MYTRLAALAAAAALWTQPLVAEPYTLFIYEDPGEIALRSLADGAGAETRRGAREEAAGEEREEDGEEEEVLRRQARRKEQRSRGYGPAEAVV